MKRVLLVLDKKFDSNSATLVCREFKLNGLTEKKKKKDGIFNHLKLLLRLTSTEDKILYLFEVTSYYLSYTVIYKL